jgi:hypothetical protein
MKAEHRKELETNALAERMGRVVQGIKQKPQKRTMLWMVAAAVVVVIILFFWRRGVQRAEENSRNWMILGAGSGQNLEFLVKEDPQSNQAKAVEFESRYAIFRYLLERLTTDPNIVLANLDNLAQGYRELEKLCKDDKVLLPEALFAQAVIEETRILKDDDKWKSALAAYKVVADNHKDSAFGKLAAKRVEVLENNDKRRELLLTYQDLRREFVREDRLTVPPPVDSNSPPAEAPLKSIIPEPPKSGSPPP